MPIIYVNSAAVGLNDGSSKANAYIGIQSALTAWAIGDEVWVHKDHSESSGSVTLTCAASGFTNPCVIKVVDFNNDTYAPNSPTPQLISSATMTFNLSAVIYGLNVRAATGFTNSAAARFEFFDSTLNLTGNANFSLGTSNRKHATKFVNCSISFDLAARFLLAGTNLSFYGGSVSGTILASSGIVYLQNSNTVEFNSCDLSGVDLVTNSANLAWFSTADTPSSVSFTACEMPVFTTATNTVDDQGQEVRIISSDTSGNVSHQEFYGYAGTFITDTGVYRSGGFTEKASGAQSSIKMSPDVTCDYNEKLIGTPVMAHVDTTGLKTITLEFAHDFTALLKSNEFYFDIMYVGTVGSTLGAFETTGPFVAGSVRDPISSGVTLATSLEAWTGATGLFKQSISKQVTFNKAGAFLVIPKLATYEAGKSLYYDPSVTVA